MYRKADWFKYLCFAYDMSVPNVAHLEPQRGGCCTVMPYFLPGGMLELPLTTIQDYSLFHILQDYSLAVWKQQIQLIHTAAQPSHDKAAAIPYDDFDVNAVGTLNMLVAARDFCRDAPFCFTSTNKVYGDRPNALPLLELDRRYDYANGLDGISEAMSIDQCLHALFGASKVAADVLCQEFGRYFQMPIGIFRGGCLTGPQHAAVELHGSLAVLCAVTGRP
jgi:nucleoside-diphosphate-sugar epimerase